MNIRRELTDLELCINLVPEAEEHYSRALDVLSAYPDYAKTQFRIVVEHLTLMLAKRFREPPRVSRRLFGLSQAATLEA